MRDLSLHILDIAQNSITAKAGLIKILISADIEVSMLDITIEDNGMGMDEELLARVTDPFSTTRTTRKVGLGIPLFKSAAERCEGRLDINSKKGHGTVLNANFAMRNIDRPPLGDIAETIAGIILSNPEVNLELKLVCGTNSFEMDTLEFKERLGEVSITEYDVLVWIKEYVNEGILTIFGGVLDEIHS